MVENTIQIKSRITINAIKTITITTTKTIKIQQNIMYILAIMLGILVHVLLSVISIVRLMNMLKFRLPIIDDFYHISRNCEYPRDWQQVLVIKKQHKKRTVIIFCILHIFLYVTVLPVKITAI